MSTAEQIIDLVRILLEKQVAEIEDGIVKQVTILKDAAQNQCDELGKGTEKQIAALKDAVGRECEEVEKGTAKKLEILRNARDVQLKALEDMMRQAENLLGRTGNGF